MGRTVNVPGCCASGTRNFDIHSYLIMNHKDSKCCPVRSDLIPVLVIHFFFLPVFLNISGDSL